MPTGRMRQVGGRHRRPSVAVAVLVLPKPPPCMASSADYQRAWQPDLAHMMRGPVCAVRRRSKVHEDPQTSTAGRPHASESQLGVAAVLALALRGWRKHSLTCRLLQSPSATINIQCKPPQTRMSFGEVSYSLPNSQSNVKHQGEAAPVWDVVKALLAFTLVLVPTAGHQATPGINETSAMEAPTLAGK
jgi:hypothetical protein